MISECSGVLGKLKGSPENSAAKILPLVWILVWWAGRGQHWHHQEPTPDLRNPILHLTRPPRATATLASTSQPTAGHPHSWILQQPWAGACVELYLLSLSTCLVTRDILDEWLTGCGEKPGWVNVYCD